MSLYFKYIKNTLKNLSLSRCSTGWPLKMCKYQGQKRCLQRYWYSFSLPWRCKYFQNTLLTIFGFKITIFIPKWLFRGVNWIKSVKMSDFDPKKVITIFEIICIFTAAKNYTNNFADTFFGPDTCTSSKVIPYCTSIKTDFSMYFLNI